jgi:histidyl-tRNA synthetase
MKVLPVNTDTFFRRSVGVAEHYGFRNIDDLRAEAKETGTTLLELERQKGPRKNFEHQILARVLEKCNNVVELKKKQPLMFYTPSVVSHPATPSVRVSALSLNAVGTDDPLAEVVLIKTATSILEELGVKNLRIRVNSIGDNDSSARFIKEVASQLRQRTCDLSPAQMTVLRSEPETFVTELYAARHTLIQELPSPIEFLTTPSRRHFKEVLELLDFTGITYDLDEKLYADSKVYSHTLFEVSAGEQDPEDAEDTVIARGGRYDELTRVYVRGTVPSTGLVIAGRTKDQRKEVGRPRRKKPTACLIHIGREARIRSISIVETFRREKIPIEQCLHFERFSEQMAYAEALSAKYIIIMGQREAKDGVVLVRNTASRSQQTVRIDILPDMLRKLVAE